jgi:hypothetical protein
MSLTPKDHGLARRPGPHLVVSTLLCGIGTLVGTSDGEVALVAANPAALTLAFQRLMPDRLIDLNMTRPVGLAPLECTASVQPRKPEPTLADWWHAHGHRFGRRPRRSPVDECAVWYMADETEGVMARWWRRNGRHRFARADD